MTEMDTIRGSGQEIHGTKEEKFETVDVMDNGFTRIPLYQGMIHQHRGVIREQLGTKLEGTATR